MATIYKQKNGRYVIQVGEDRRTGRLGKLSPAGAAALRVHVTALETAAKTATTPPVATVAWLGDIDAKLHAKLSAIGLCAPRVEVVAFGAPLTIARLFVDHLSRRKDLKPFTIATLEQTKNRCVEYFGATRRADSITNADAKDFRRWLKNTARQRNGSPYAQATVAGFVNKTRQLMNDAVERRLLVANPFRKVSGGTQVNKSRLAYVNRDTIERVIAACQSDEWRLLIALGRYAGMRVPSETARLKFTDIDMMTGMMKVTSPKTENQGKPFRMTPIFPELRPHLDAIIATAPIGQEYVLPFIRHGYNPQTQFRRILKIAGVIAWPRLFQNLRSTRATELRIVEGFDRSVVSEWLGHTPEIEDKHYLQVMKEDVDRAINGSAAKSAAISTGDLGTQRPIRNETGVFAENSPKPLRFTTYQCPDLDSNQKPAD